MMIQKVFFFYTQTESGSGRLGMTPEGLYIVPGSSPTITNQHRCLWEPCEIVVAPSGGS